MASNDPAAFFRDWLGQWEKMTNSFGNDAMKSEEFTRGMQGASAATMTMQAAFKDMMEKVLAAANLPTRADFDALASRVAGIEASLSRIETTLGAAPTSAPKKPKPSRGRKPPKD